MNKSLKKPKKRKILILITSIFLPIVLIFGICVMYISDFYKADKAAIEAFLSQDIVCEETSDGVIVFDIENAKDGFIFYPGGKVEYTSYLPLMYACAKEGIFCILIEMPFNLAIFDINAADGLKDKYPHIENWYIGGHSLGGSMAASYLDKHHSEFDGLVLLGAYSTNDLSKTELEVLSIYGSNDLIMNRKKYEQNKKNLPINTKEIVINGGCHSYFGMYGLQDGDGTPTISNEEQINLTAKYIKEIVK